MYLSTEMLRSEPYYFSSSRINQYLLLRLKEEMTQSTVGRWNSATQNDDDCVPSLSGKKLADELERLGMDAAVSFTEFSEK